HAKLPALVFGSVHLACFCSSLMPVILSAGRRGRKWRTRAVTSEHHATVPHGSVVRLRSPEFFCLLPAEQSRKLISPESDVPFHSQPRWFEVVAKLTEGGVHDDGRPPRAFREKPVVEGPVDWSRHGDVKQQPDDNDRRPERYVGLVAVAHCVISTGCLRRRQFGFSARVSIPRDSRTTRAVR